MNHNELLIAFCNRDTGHTRKIGQYWASDLYNIIKKKVTPEDFFKRRPIDLEGAKRILSGVAFETQWESILIGMGVEHQYNPRMVYPMAEGLDLIVRPDFVFPDRVVETKFPGVIHDDIPAWHAYQMEAEFRVTGLPVYAGYFVHPFDIVYKKFEPSDARWDKIKKAVFRFHEQVKKLEAPCKSQKGEALTD
jgi:hypothetical protein